VPAVAADPTNRHDMTWLAAAVAIAAAQSGTQTQSDEEQQNRLTDNSSRV